MPKNLSEEEKEIINKFFEITGDINDYVLQKDVHRILRVNVVTTARKAVLVEIERRVKSKALSLRAEQFTVQYRCPNPPRARVYRGMKKQM